MTFFSSFDLGRKYDFFSGLGSKQRFCTGARTFSRRPCLFGLVALTLSGLLNRAYPLNSLGR